MRLSLCPALLSTVLLIVSCNRQPEKEIDSAPLLGAGFGISHATLMVNNLDSARDHYNKVLGFALPPSKDAQDGEYAGTKGLTVAFAGFSTIELMAIKDSAIVAKQHPFINSFLAHQNGVRFFALSTSSVDSTRRWMNQQGYKTDTALSGRDSKVQAKGWTYDDGGAQWSMLADNNNNPTASLPMFMELKQFPYTEVGKEWKPYAWRKYYDSNANGAVGVSSLMIVVANLDSARQAYKHMGLKMSRSDDSSVWFMLPHEQQLQLVTSTKPDDKFSRFLQTHGAGVYAIRFDVRNFDTTRAFLSRTLPREAITIDASSRQLSVAPFYAYGVQLEFREESKEIAALAKIYGYKQGSKLDTTTVIHAAGLYGKYCALCHGKDREGYAADHAPSLRSLALMATTIIPQSNHNFLSHTIAYGRTGTAMAPYAKNQGGPLDEDDIDLLIAWLQEASGVKKPIELSPKSIPGNAVAGKEIYGKHCASCHGLKGEGIIAPALANPLFLATASDAFIQYTVTGGREGTRMPSFKDSLSKADINAVTAYIRSRASGWNAPQAIVEKERKPGDYVLNPTSKAPVFQLREDRYVSADQLSKALKDHARIILLDARSGAAWHQTHIPGAISVPYYQEPDKFIKDIPNDSTMIVVYCACPHAASGRVVSTLKRFNYKHTAILDEGILVWAQRGLPVANGDGAGAVPKK